MDFIGFLVTLVWIYVIFLIVRGIIRYLSPKKNTYELDNLNLPVFTTENIGRNYIALGMVKSSSDNEAKGLNDLLRQAISMNAEAIVGMNMNISNDVSGNVSSGFSGKHTRGRTTTKTTYHYTGTAVKFNEGSNNE